MQETSLRFDGSAYRTMLRNDAYWFSRLGLYLERADNTARILDVKYHVLLPEEEHVGGPLDYFQWTSILRSVSALTAYHWVYRETLKPWLVADLLILKDALPRSLASCYGNLVRYLDQIGVAYGRQGAAQRHARGVRNRLEHSHMDDIFQHGLHEFIQEFIAARSDLARAVAEELVQPCLGTPQSRRLDTWRGREVLPYRLEQLSDEALGRPVGQADPAAGFADACKFARRTCLVRGEHHAEGGQHYVERRVGEWQILGVGFLELDLETLGLRTCPPRFEQ